MATEDFILEGVDMTPKASGYPNLYQAIMRLPAKAKQAMYAAASARKISQGTWNGCAFNAGGMEIGNANIHSYEAAAAAFDCSIKVVQAFIAAWDGLPERGDHATRVLRETLEEVGLFHEPTRAIRIVRTVEWKSEQTKLVEAFRAEMENPDFTVDGLTEACELLGV
jgi:hypothetical protein